MNTLVMSAGALATFTTLVHLIGGQLTIVRPFLQSEAAADVKGCLLVCWHAVSAYLALSAAVLIHAASSPTPQLSPLVLAISGFYVLFALLFLVIGVRFFGVKTLYKLPQWTLLLPVGLLGLWGTV